METTSDLLFNFDVMMWNFSVKHKLDVLLTFRYGLARSMIPII